MTQWIEVLVGMADGPTTPVRGTANTYRRTSEPTPDFDWICAVTVGRIDDAGLATLQQRLHPGVPVTGAPELVPPTETSW